MSRAIMLVPICNNVGLQSVGLGVIRGMEREGINIKYFRPVLQNDKYSISDDIFSKYNLVPIDQSLKTTIVELALIAKKQDMLIEGIIDKYYLHSQNTEVVLIEGIITKYQFSTSLNYEIAKALNAKIIFVLKINSNDLLQAQDYIKLTQNSFGGMKNKNIVGVIFNKINAPIDHESYIFSNVLKIIDNCQVNKGIDNNLKKTFIDSPLPIIGKIPWNSNLIKIRAIDIYNYLNARIINQGDIKTRRIKSIVFCSYSLHNIIKYFNPETLLVISADRQEIIIEICLAVMNRIKISAILLTGIYKINKYINKLCKHAFQNGLPVFMVNHNIWQTFLHLQKLNITIPNDDVYRIEQTQEYIANFIKPSWIKSLTLTSNHSIYLSPAAFRYKLIELSRKAKKCIVLPEGNEPRTIQAAIICAERKIANCILLGCPQEIRRVSISQGINLNNAIKIINPVTIKEKYIARLVELRKHKGMNSLIAKTQLEDNVVLGTMMLEKNEVDGLVSGAIHTTANTIRPSLQIIKMLPNSSLVSSIFFMLLPDEVLIYADCAINPNPNSIQLADIAIQSADSAILFGIEPRVAMISYSTGNSGVGSDVEKVRQATLIAQKKRPDLIIDGPLQYDAAIIEDVAKLKAPTSKVAGKATVLIFPDLNTGNTTYKAVQRSANVISIGPMLQGIRKPVNDLSRGASIDDIVYTIALTAIQAAQNKK
ncbi:phosphate acetyltransferase [Candidatus Pantoea edessiphila]|uniref:Phosphate acetyltransferase n=1 Tax=Candidatus Pantoea edessiphila TaxID=2044610 RepID=A0A2P5SX67_9GAMM|nr:phosphate acetyltransferase [Candidatus Pantoea edessiphila]PPI86931.1 phosphate acetyltransferase [Candidatus Pantoea edessiphila]